MPLSAVPSAQCAHCPQSPQWLSVKAQANIMAAYSKFLVRFAPFTWSARCRGINAGRLCPLPRPAFATLCSGLFFNKSSNLFASLDDVECKSHWHLSSFDSLPPSRPHQLAASVIGAATLQHKSRQEQTRDKGTRKLFDFVYDAQYDPAKACCD